MQSTTDSKIRASQTKARRGVSLIEVLVVLVILVTGILVIIRLYPSGFFSVQSVGNAAVADSLGAAELQAAQQTLGSLPEAIQPGGTDASFPGGMDAYGRPQATALDASYDPEFNSSQEPDYSATLNRARLVVNETMTVPTASTIVTPSGSVSESIYVAKFGPIVTEALPQGTTAPYTPTPKLQNYLSVNSTNWQPVTADSFLPPPTQNVSEEGQPQFSVDYIHQRIAVPYAAYEYDTVSKIYKSYAQTMIVSIIGSDYKTYTEYLNIPAATDRDSKTPYAPYTNAGDAIARAFLPDTPTNYHGGWFDPTMTYGDTGANAQPTLLPGVTWLSVSLYRPYIGVGPTDNFSTANFYQYRLTSPNLGSTAYNLGGLAFNPMAGGGVGRAALKARISYRVADWKVIHEDRDVPALPAGNTSVLRLALKNLKRAGDEGPNNSIDPGLLGSGHSMFILDLDTGQQVAPATGGAADPTNPDLPIIDEDVLGTSTDPAAINVSFATGRLTFGSNAFNDNSKAHRIRIFYAGDLDWTVAIQKAPAYYVVDNQAQVTANGGIRAGHCYYDANTTSLLFPQSDAGKTVEVDGSPDQPGQTAAIGDAVANMGGVNYVSLPYSLDATKITAVRGLSARAVVAWQERGQWKSHSVDTILNRTP